jgi:pimeloyl-[acyl-carrier protein] synthase
MTETQPSSTASTLDLASERWDVLLEEEQRQSNIVYNPRSSQLRTNPYPLLHTLRDTDPVHWSPLLGAWLLTRYQDVHTFLRRPELSKDFRTARSGPLGNIGFLKAAPAQPSMLVLDPPDHTRLRSLVNKAFTPQAVEALKPRIQAIADTLLQDVKSDEPFDLMEVFANPLPIMVIAEMLGLPTEDREQFKAWSNDFVLGLNVSSSDETQMRGDIARESLWAYYRRIVEERRHKPGDDLVSALLAVEEQGDRLTEEELLMMCQLLLVAGNETTTNLIGNGLLALLQHPEQSQLLRKEPSRMAQAVEEMLRYDSPVQAVQRVVTAETEINGKCIAPGTTVIILIGAANRDPDVFPKPDIFDITRNGPHHVSFGHGIHYCLGAPLARAEASIGIATLLRRFSGLELTTEAPAWRDSPLFRGLSTLPLIPRL